LCPIARENGINNVPAANVGVVDINTLAAASSMAALEYGGNNDGNDNGDDSQLVDFIDGILNPEFLSPKKKMHERPRAAVKMAG
jgi:hypothetical protein